MAGNQVVVAPRHLRQVSARYVPATEFDICFRAKSFLKLSRDVHRASGKIDADNLRFWKFFIQCEGLVTGAATCDQYAPWRIEIGLPHRLHPRHRSDLPAWREF